MSSNYNMMMQLQITNYNTNTELDATVQYAYLQPQQGSWEGQQPGPGTQVPANGVPVVFNANNTTYPFGVEGMVILEIGTVGQLSITFNYQLTSATALVNGASSTKVGTVPVSVSTDLNNNVLNIMVSIGTAPGGGGGSSSGGGSGSGGSGGGGKQ
jgi:hypothetical protein